MKKRLSIFLCVCLALSLCVFSAAADDGILKAATVDELIAAIAPGAVIRLDEGSYDLAEAATYGGRTGNPYVKWVECWQGWELQIHDVDGLVITGSGKDTTVIRAECRDANVLSIADSTGIVLQNFTAGHSPMTDACSGGVINIYRSEDIQLTGLGLFGCGSWGIQSSTSVGITVTDTEIYECSSCAFSLYENTNVLFENCVFRDIGMTASARYQAYDLFSVSESRNVIVRSSTAQDSSVSYLMNINDSDEILFENVDFAGNAVTEAMLDLWNADVCLGKGVNFIDNSFSKWYQPDWMTGEIHRAVDEEGQELELEDPAPKHTVSEPMEYIPVESGEQTEIRVATTDEFLNAIAPNVRIVLTEEMYDLSTAESYGQTRSPWYYWVDNYDGPGLVISNVSNFTIVSEDGAAGSHTIAAVPRYANVLTFRNCTGVTVQSITAGHTAGRSECSGGVLSFEYCADVLTENCDLFGCGILGVSSEGTLRLQVANSRIFDCSYGGISCSNSYGVTIGGCDFWNLGGSIFQIWECADVVINGQSVGDTYFGD